MNNATLSKYMDEIRENEYESELHMSHIVQTFSFQIFYYWEKWASNSDTNRILIAYKRL